MYSVLSKRISTTYISDCQAYKSKERMFSSKYNDSKQTYQIQYMCVHYHTNTTRDEYLAGRKVVWNEANSTISSDGLVGKRYYKYTTLNVFTTIHSKTLLS